MQHAWPIHVLTLHFNPPYMYDSSLHLSYLLLAATNLCFQEKSIFTQEVLAAVLQLLLEQTPIPVLFMRTVMV